MSMQQYNTSNPINVNNVITMGAVIVHTDTLLMKPFFCFVMSVHLHSCDRKCSCDNERISSGMCAPSLWPFIIMSGPR
jgi:hypothetical protein